MTGFVVTDPRNGEQQAPIPILPVLGIRDLAPIRASAVPCIEDIGRPLFVRRGSEAIFLALRHAGVGERDEVLVPAFHCPSMVVPVGATGAMPVFYEVSEDLSVGVAALEKVLGSRTRAVLVPHFFGRLQSLADIRSFCDAHRLALIEDCAHAYFGEIDGQPCGTLGHYAIGSPRKFFPVAEGGLLTSAERDLRGTRAAAPGIVRSARTVFDAVDIATSFGRMSGLQWMVDLARSLRPERGAGGEDPGRRPDGESRNAQSVSPMQASAFTRYVIAHGRGEAQLAARRRNFSLLVEKIGELRGFQLLGPVLHATSVPYMVPVVLESPVRQFAELKRRGIPIWRWEHSARGVCRTTDRYATSLIQVPCHQSLRASEIGRIIDAFRECQHAAS